ncbi:MAG: alpha/beta fold hydrolase [Blautia sp.]
MKEQITISLQSEYDAHPLSVLELVPEKVRGVLQIVHGMSEYKERYLPFMEYMADRGFVCVIHDHRGHGASIYKEEDLGYMYNGRGRALVGDILQVNTWIREKWEGLPFVLLGHSMGSLAVRAFAKKHDDRMDMLVVCGSPSKNPALKMGKAIASIQRGLFGPRHKSRLIETLSFGGYAARFPGEKNKNAWVCSNPQVITEYSESSLCGFTFSVDGYQALFDLMEETYSEKGWDMKNPKLPILFISGAEDPCLGNVRKFAQTVQHMRLRGYHDVKGKLYPGMRHEILNETEKEKVYHDVYVYVMKKLYPTDSGKE